MCIRDRINVVQVDFAKSGRFLMSEVPVQDFGFKHELHDNWKVSPDDTFVHTGGVFLLDYDRDSRTDVLLVDEPRAHSVLLYRGVEDGHFEDVTRKVGLHRTGTLAKAGVIDIDNDGWEDIVFPGVAVYRNNAGQGFENMTGASNLTSLILRNGPI